MVVFRGSDVHLLCEILGTMLMTPERQRAIWAIYGKLLSPHLKNFTLDEARWRTMLNDMGFGITNILFGQNFLHVGKSPKLPAHVWLGPRSPLSHTMLVLWKVEVDLERENHGLNR